MQSYEAVGIVTKGRLGFDQERLAAAVRLMPDGVVTLRVERRRAARSVAQNAYLWSTVYAYVSEHTGFTAEEVHEWAKCRFLPKSLAFSNGNGVVVDAFVIGGSTTQLDTKGMTDYIEAIRTFALENLGLEIPDPQ